MQVAIERHHDAAHINAIVNHPDVYEYVKGPAEGPLDFAPVMASAAGEHFYVLMGEHGGQVYERIQPGLFEVHSHFLKAGRGDYALQVTKQTLHWMFTRTEAVECMTRCPVGNPAAKALARAIGGHFEFQNPRGWMLGGKVVPADIYALRIQDWIRSAPGLVERGQWFHDRLEAELARHGASELAHPDDSEHDRHVGAAVEMFFGGQPLKGQVFYNRFASLGGYQRIAITSLDPLTVDIGNAALVMQGGDFVIPDMPAQN
jgi:RimJ/RimL family protein N-acetyltransferase